MPGFLLTSTGNRWKGGNRLTMTKIEILGTGCAKCKRLFANAEQAVKDLKITAEVVKVEDLAEIVGRGVMLPPALFINGEVRSEGRIPDVNEIRKMLNGVKQ
jgi:small redox-active disulfide protein 2